MRRLSGASLVRYAAQEPADPPQTAIRSERAPTSFPATTRWLRGRILDRLREAPGEAWVALDAPIGTHDIERVHRALAALAGEGMVELRRTETETVHARLATG